MSATVDLDAWIERIKSRDSETFEDAYDAPRPSGPAVVPRLVAEMHAARDGYARGKFIELLGEIAYEAVVPELVAELDHAEKPVRDWTVAALEMIGGEEAHQAVLRHKAKYAADFI